MFMILKKIKRKEIRNRIYRFLIIFSMLVVSVSCSNPNKIPDTGNTRNFVVGEIAVALNHDGAISELLSAYSAYELMVERHFFSGSWYILSFNYQRINGEDLVRLLDEDDLVYEALLRPGWYQGELIARIVNLATEEEIESFVNSFSEFGLTLTGHIRRNSYFRFSFDHQSSNELETRRTLGNHPKVLMIDFNGPERQWKSGSIFVVLQDDVEYLDFINSYTHIEDIRFWYLEFGIVAIYFDYRQIDEFSLIEIFLNDPNVRLADFNLYNEFE